MSKGERNGSRSASAPPWQPRPRSRAGSSAAARRTATGSSTPARTPTRPRPPIGQRLHRLEPDPIAAPVVQRIFAEYLGGDGLLRHRRRPQPRRHPVARPAHDPARNRHRATARAVGEVAPSGPSSPTPATPATRSGTSSARTRCSSTSTTSRSATRPRCAGTTATSGSGRPSPIHEPLVTPRAVRRRPGDVRPQQAGRRTRTPTQGRHVPARRAACAAGSAAGGCRASGTTAGAYYRCQFAEEYADRRPATTPATSTSGKTPSCPASTRWLATLFDDDHIDDTCDALAGAPSPTRAVARARGRARAPRSPTATASSPTTAPLLDHEDAVDGRRRVDRRDPARAQARSSASSASTIPGGQLTAEQVKALVERLRDIVDGARRRRPGDKAELYDELGIDTHLPPRRHASPSSHRPRGVRFVSEGGLEPPRPLVGH